MTDDISLREDQAASRADVERVANEIRLVRPDWEVGQVITVGEHRWCPDLVQHDPPALLHIHLTESLPAFVVDRLQAAHSDGYEIHVATPLEGLYDEELLMALHAVEPQVCLLEEGAPPADCALPTLLADRRIKVSTGVRKAIAAACNELSQQAASNFVKGRRFESLVVFLLSQIEDFEVIKRNYRTESEELDAVVKQRSTTGRVWALPGAPLVLVEGKNRADKTSASDVSNFRTKMKGKRKTVRLGFLVSSRGFTADARLQELRFASEDLTIAFVGPREIEAWIASTDDDAYLENVVTEAMLR